MPPGIGTTVNQLAHITTPQRSIKHGWQKGGQQYEDKQLGSQAKIAK